MDAEEYRLASEEDDEARALEEKEETENHKQNEN